MNGPQVRRLSPERVRQAEFSRSALGRRGYSVDEVDRFLGRLAEDLAARDAREERLRTEVASVKQALKEWQSANARGVAGTTDVDAATGVSRANTEAVSLLSRAQQQADSYIAQAQDYCRRLVDQARGQAEAVLGAARGRLEAGGGEVGAARAREMLAAIGEVEDRLRAAREMLARDVEGR